MLLLSIKENHICATDLCRLRLPPLCALTCQSVGSENVIPSMTLAPAALTGDQDDLGTDKNKSDVLHLSCHLQKTCSYSFTKEPAASGEAGKRRLNVTFRQRHTAILLFPVGEISGKISFCCEQEFVKRLFFKMLFNRFF